MSKDSGGTPTVFMLAMLAGMFTQQGFQGKGMRGLLTDDTTTMHQRLISEHMRQDQGGGLSATIDNAWQGGGTPAVQGSVAFGMDSTFNTMMKLEDSQGGVDQTMQVAFSGFEDQAAHVQILGRYTLDPKMVEASGDKNHRYAGFTEQKIVDVMKIRTWEGGLTMDTRQSHHLATEISGPITGFAG